MAYLVKRGNVWWYRVKENGKWDGHPTEFKVSDPTGERNAKRLAKRAQDRINARVTTGAPSGPLTVKRYALDTWIVKRQEADLDWKNDRSRLEHHVFSVIGDMNIADVRAKQIADLVHRWRFVTKLAQRTVYNVYSTVTAMFRDAAIDGEIDQTPCILTNDRLGPLVDSDPEWRDGAKYTRDEAETIISDERVPFDRRVFYAFMLLGGLRPGEIAVLRWRNLDASVEPLGKLTVSLALNTRKMSIKGTKTGAVRHVPTHATLAAMLAEWKLSGWAEMMGRMPEPDDLIIPLPPADAKARRSREGEPIRTGDYAGKKWREVDRPMLGIREREMYAMKATFITLCGEDGAEREAIKRITHAKVKRDAYDGYDRASHWLETCEAIAKLRIARKRIRPALVRLDGGA